MTTKSEMTSMERIVAAVQHKEADRVPCCPMIAGASRRVYGVTYAEWAKDGELTGKCMLQAQELVGFDFFLTLVDLSVEAADFGQEVVFPIENTPHPNYDNPMIKCKDDYSKIQRFDPTKSPRMTEQIKYYNTLVAGRGSTVPVCAFVYGPLGILSMLRSAEKLFVDCMKYKADVIEGLNIVEDVLDDYIKATTETGAPAVILDTLYSSECIMSKKLWVETEGPFSTRMANAVRKGGSMVLIHNCGNGPYFDVQIEAMEPAGISFLFPPADCNNDWKVTKEKWGDKTCLIGVISPPQYGYISTPEEAKEECKREIADLAKGGGFIMATGCEYPPNGSLLNAIAMMEAAELYGKY